MSRRVPAAFTETWDRWLRAALDGSRERLGGRWREQFLSMPVWRFIFSARIVTPHAWAGVLLPSVDAVGRYFPLAIVAALPAATIDLVATLFAARSWFDDMEQIGLSGIAPGVDATAFDARICARPFREDWLRYREGTAPTPAGRGAHAQWTWIDLGQHAEPEHLLTAALRNELPQFSEPSAAWLAEPSELFGRSLLLCEALPPAEQLCAMMNGRWAEHGWGRPRGLPVS